MIVPIRISEPAAQELKEIWQHYAEISEELAQRIVHRIRTRITLLGQFPKFGRVRPEFKIAGMRSVAVQPHVIFYSVSAEPRITIHHIVDGRRNLAALFHEDDV